MLKLHFVLTIDDGTAQYQCNDDNFHGSLSVRSCLSFNFHSDASEVRNF